MVNETPAPTLVLGERPQYTVAVARAIPPRPTSDSWLPRWLDAWPDAPIEPWPPSLRELLRLGPPFLELLTVQLSTFAPSGDPGGIARLSEEHARTGRRLQTLLRRLGGAPSLA